MAAQDLAWANSLAALSNRLRTQRRTCFTVLILASALCRASYWMGLRDRNGLQSALARPRQHHAYADPNDTITFAALYTAGILRNHPFIDGNKRTGFVLGVLFLETNGYRFTAPEEDATQAVLDLAQGVIDEIAYASWLRVNSRKRRAREHLDSA